MGAVVDSSGCEIPLSIESIKHINKIYPIPADNTLTIEFRENIKVDHIYLVGMNGNLQKSLTFIKSRKKADVNVSGIDSGIYILNIITEKDILKVKVIIER